MDEVLRAKRQSTSGSSMRAITIRGAREHNLKNVDLEIPRDKLVVFTGLSGSGKSSLAFDTIYAEGQRRYVESLSAYARQFLEMMQKPDVDQIDVFEIVLAGAANRYRAHVGARSRLALRPDHFIHSRHFLARWTAQRSGAHRRECRD